MKIPCSDPRLRAALPLTLLLLVHGAQAQAFESPAPPPSPSILDTIQAGADIALSNKTVDSVTAGRDAALDNMTVHGATTAGRNIQASNSAHLGELIAGRDVTLSDCPDLTGLTAGRDAYVMASQLKGNLRAGRMVTLRDMKIVGDVMAGDAVEAMNTQIDGALHLGGVTPSRLDNVRVGEIRVSAPAPTTSSTLVSPGSVIASGVSLGSGVVISGGSANVRVQNGRTQIAVRPGGLSSVNGYTVKASASSTTLVTPDGSVYVNGKRASGNVPPHYEDYRLRYAEAPVIEGPGWGKSAPCACGKKGKTDANAVPTGVAQTLELRGNTQVEGLITFESGNGVILLHPGVTLSQKPVGAKVFRVTADSPTQEIR